MKPQGLAILLFTGLLFISFKNPVTNPIKTTVSFTQLYTPPPSDSVIIYKSDQLIIQRLSPHIYQHISFLNTTDFGRVSCNGMIVINEKEAIVFDTPADDNSSGELINFISKELNCIIKGVIPTHFHEDCVGGLEKFTEHQVPAYASAKTIALLQQKGRTFSNPIHPFNDSLRLAVGNKNVYIEYFGEGHTTDNVIGYFPDDRAVFGGCLIKEVGATKGYLGDANIAAWSGTVEKIRQKYPHLKIVIPGHGKSGGTELLDYTIKLFE